LIEEKMKGKGSNEYVATLNNIAAVYDNQKN